MAQETDTITLQFLEKGSAELEAKLISLERRSLQFMKSINTAMKNNNLSTAKANRTKLKDNELAIKSDRIEKKEIDAKIKSIKNAESATMMMSRKFLQAGLSVMFFGMQMQKTFQTLATQSLTTFNKLNADTESANNATNRLSAQMEGLSYIIGDAINTVLESMEGWLTNIINLVMDIINENQSWLGWAIILGLIVGTLMATVGQVGLLILGLNALKGSGGFAAVGASATAAGSAGSKGILSMVGAIVSVIVVWGILIGLFTGNEWTRKLIVGFVKLVGNIIITMIWVGFKIQQVLFGAFFYIIKAILSLFDWLGVGIGNVIIKAVNWMLNAVETALNKILQSSAFQKFAKFMGWNIGKVNLGQLEYMPQTSISDRLSGVTDEFIHFIQKDMFDLNKVKGAFGSGLEQTLGVGLERMFAKNEETTEKQVQAANKNLLASDINLQTASIMNSLMSQNGAPNSGSVTSEYSNGTISYGWSSVIGGTTT